MGIWGVWAGILGFAVMAGLTLWAVPHVGGQSPPTNVNARRAVETIQAVLVRLALLLSLAGGLLVPLTQVKGWVQWAAAQHPAVSIGLGLAALVLVIVATLTFLPSAVFGAEPSDGLALSGFVIPLLIGFSLTGEAGAKTAEWATTASQFAAQLFGAWF